MVPRGLRGELLSPIQAMTDMLLIKRLKGLNLKQNSIAIKVSIYVKSNLFIHNTINRNLPTPPKKFPELQPPDDFPVV